MTWGQIYGLAMGAFVVGLFLFSWHRLRKRGIGLKEAWLGKKFAVEVRGDADALCKRALLEVAGSRTTRKFKKGKLRALTHIADAGPGSAAVEFALEPAQGEYTRVLVAVWGGGQFGAELNDEHAVERAKLGERLADWLAEQGDGRRVRHT